MKRLSAAKVLPTLASFFTLAAGLALMNDDIRRSLARLLSGAAGTDAQDMTWQVENAAMAVYQAVRDQSIEHAPLTIFIVAAGVLLVFMLRT
jgi:hypothetical protein